GRRLNRLGVERLEVESDRLLTADDRVAAALEVFPRLRVALGHLSLQLRPAGLERVAAELGEHRGTDAAAAHARRNDEVRLRVAVRPRVHEAAGGRLALEPRDEVDERVARGEVVAYVVQTRRRLIRLRGGPHGDHGLEVRV